MSVDRSNTNNNSATHNISTLEQDTNNNNTETTQYDQFKKGKKKQRLPEVDPNKPCFIHQLSVEIITHVFARLDPISLAIVAKVCSFWRHIVMDDSCWRDAFISYFGGLPFKRLSLESWKTEYILRTHLIRKWTKGRGTVLSFNPKIGSLESMQVNMDEASMLVASTDNGVAVKCNPLTGKVSHRHLLYSSNESIRLQLTAVAMNANRIAWGFSHGYVTLSMRTKSTTRLRAFSDFHQGPVTILVLPTSFQDVVVSGAEDGLVNVWDVTTASCAWTLQAVSALARVPTCLQVTNDHRILIGYDDGSMVIWHINLNQLLQLHRNRQQDDYPVKRAEKMRDWEAKKIVIEAPVSETHCAVKYMSYDELTHQVIVAYVGQTEILKYSTNTGACVGVFAYGHGVRTSITCIQWDKTPVSSILSLESALKPRPVSGANRKKTSGGIIDLSSTSSSPASTSRSTSGQGTPLNTKTTRLLVTGDDMGTLCLWNGDDVNQDNRTIKPLRILNDGHIMAISSIYVDACKIVTGSDDGWIRMWDPLTGININTLGNKISKNAPVDRTDVDMMRVKNIWCNDYQGVATIGHQVKTWDFSPGNQLLTNRRVLKQKGKPSSNTIVRDRIRYELDLEVKESIKKLETEKIERAKEEKHINKLSLGLTDEEMLDYAMMLSQQEESLSNQDASNGFVDENDEELMKAVIASLEHQQLENDLNSDSGDFSLDSGSSYSQSTSIAEWPTAAEASNNSTQESVDEDMDEELRYILELSKTDK